MFILNNTNIRKDGFKFVKSCHSFLIDARWRLYLYIWYILYLYRYHHRNKSMTFWWHPWFFYHVCMYMNLNKLNKKPNQDNDLVLLQLVQEITFLLFYACSVSSAILYGPNDTDEICVQMLTHYVWFAYGHSESCT